jgi:outer membrane protein
MKRNLPLLCLALLLCLPMGAAADEILSLKLGYLNLTPSGQFASREGVVNTTIDLENDFGIEDEADLMAEAALQLGAFRLSAGYLPLKFSGSSTLGRSITFNNRTFNVNEQATGEIDVKLYDLGLTWHLVNVDDLPVRVQLGPELAVKIVDGEASVTSQLTGLSESVSGTAPVPTIGLRARVGLGDMLGLIGRVGYVQYQDNSFLDADAQVEFSPIPLVGVFLGYRYLDLEVDEGDLFVDATFDGPYAGALVRF